LTLYIPSYDGSHMPEVSLTPLLKGSDLPTKIGRTITGEWQQFWPDVLPAATNDLYGYWRELKSGSLGANPSP